MERLEAASIGLPGVQVRVVERCASTNSVLLEGRQHPVLLAAEEQTAGRGRRGRSWSAPLGTGLCLSVGWQFSGMPAGPGPLTLAVGVAVRRALERVAGVSIALKWPNDLVFDERTLGGILVEGGGEHGGPVRAVIGIGINGNWKAADFPWLLAAIMTSLRQLSGNRPIDHSALLGAFLARLEPRYEALLAGKFDAAGWTATQITTGRQVVVDAGGESILGKATGVDPESGALLLARDGKTILSIDSGEVTRCRIT